MSEPASFTSKTERTRGGKSNAIYWLRVCGVLCFLVKARWAPTTLKILFGIRNSYSIIAMFKCAFEGLSKLNIPSCNLMFSLFSVIISGMCNKKILLETALLYIYISILVSSFTLGLVLLHPEFA